MRRQRTSVTALTFASALLIGISAIASSAVAAQKKQSDPKQTSKATQASSTTHGTAPSSYRGKHNYATYGAFATNALGGKAIGHGRYAMSRAPGMSCVPYARMVTGITVSGNAWQWWDNAAGQYQRGRIPESGSVLAFRGNGRMPMGHVAVVGSVVSQREVLIDHANWPTAGGRGRVGRGISVVDVSESNDWSAVRVQLGGSDDFGSIYPTHGFIYPRPDNGMMRMATARPAPQLALNPARRDLRPAWEQTSEPTTMPAYEQVAELPNGRRGMVLTPAAPNWTQITGFNGGN